jgi:hypothetical protein
VFEQLKKDSGRKEAGSGLSGHRVRSIPVAMLLILVVLVSAGSGVYAGASYFAQQAPGVTVTTTLFTTTTSWTTSTIWSTVTEVVQGILTNIEYTTSTSTVTVTGSTSTRIPKSVTANGDARISTAQSKFGGASGLFGGGGYLSSADSGDWCFGTGDFTIDLWARFSVLPAAYNNAVLVAQQQDNANFWAVFVHNNGGTYVFYFYVSSRGSGIISMGRNTSPSLSTNTWYHFALVRSSGTFYVFQDGLQLGEVMSDADAIPDFNGLVRIGTRTTSSELLNGWLDELRVSKGVARWTSNFTPPASAHTGDSNTVLLLHMDGADGSTTFSDGY